MPICKRANFGGVQVLKNTKNDTFNDNEEVFFCEVTKEIFRDYEDYFRHVMVINSTVWQCEATGRENLTYAEALKSEKKARKKMELFKESLRAPVMLVLESAKQSSFKILNAITAKFLRKRYFLQEVVTVTTKASNIEFTVIEILLSDGSKPNNNLLYEETENLMYKLQRLEGKNEEKEIITVPFSSVKRQRAEFLTESLNMFIKHNVVRENGILRPKPESYKKYVIDHNITFKTLFIGKMPHFTPAKIKRPAVEEPKKQSSINKYLVKNNEETNNKAKLSAEQKAEKAEIKAKSLREQMERIRQEKLEKLAQQERERLEKRAKMMEKIEADCEELLNKTDDLERRDQRVLPLFKPVKSLIDVALVGEAFMIREFMHSFSRVLSGIEVFRDNLNFYEMSRAFTVHEVVGPLSDILLILLGTIFDLQRDEEAECGVEYLALATSQRNQDLYKRMSLAGLTHHYAKRSFSFKINMLPIDALTLSEVLRLHLLSSGAVVKERAEKWRIMYRNGYSSMEDPGFHFTNENPHVLHALSMYPIYQLSFSDITNIVRCLIDQILTYSKTLNLIEERLELQAKLRNDFKNMTALENRRAANIVSQRRTLNNEHNQQCLDLKENVEEQKRHLEEKLSRKVADLIAQSDREHRKFEQQAENLYTELFDYLVLIGMDRAYRKYYVLESMPGIFVEHSAESYDTCLSDPPVNKLPDGIKFDAATLPRNRKDLRSYLLKLYRDEEKAALPVPVQKQTTVAPVSEAAAQSTTVSLDNKENLENHAVNGLPNGVKNDKSSGSEVEVDIEDKVTTEEITPEKPPTQTELYMCSGDPENCIVHSGNYKDRQPWSFLYQKDDIEALIESLNPLGDRESQLREQLTTLRSQIFSHVKKCPANLLSVADPVKFKNDMLRETYRKYNKANYGLHGEENMNNVMHFALIERVLQFENDIYSGDLGRLKVKDMEKWRKDVLDDTYDPQGQLQWGVVPTANTVNGVKDAKNGDGILDKNDESVELSRLGNGFKPGEHLKDFADHDFYLKLKNEETTADRTKVRNLASALLQVEQAIERRFIKEPFGITKEVKDKEYQERKEKDATEKIRRWELSLMECTSYSQVFLHSNILDDCIIWSRSTNKSLCQICRRGSDPDQMLLCDECNGGTHMFCMKPKMKTVPEGNWYCQRCVNRLGLKNEVQKDKSPKAKKRKFIMEDTDNMSESSTTSSASKGRKAERVSKRRSGRSLHDNEIEEALVEDNSGDEQNENDDNSEEQFSDEAENSEDDKEEDETDENEQNSESMQNSTVNHEDEQSNDEDDDTTQDDDEEPVCSICSYDGSELICSKCKSNFHLECVNLRRPPRYIYVCTTCRANENSKPKRKAEADSSESSSEYTDHETAQPAPKRSRSTRSSLRGSGQHNGSSTENNSRTEAPTKPTNRRSLRRTGDDLPLNSAAIYKLLDDVMKSEHAWPFIRPVSLSEVPDYHTIIKNPMDLAKVKSKLNMGEYRINEEVMNDIQLVFKNCDKYNERGDEIYDAGKVLEKSVIKLCKDLHLPYKVSDLNK